MSGSHVQSGPRPSILTPSEVELLVGGTVSEATMGLHDIIFSCHVCHKRLSKIYSEGSQELGLNKAPINKVFLTACAHVVCAKHFDGGGVPFHREGTVPEAPCPVCKVNKNDDGAKQLYAVRGPKEGEHDPQIPPAYFEAPPTNLNDPGMEVVRFQYAALLRYSEATHAKLMLAKNVAKQSSHELGKLINPDWLRKHRKMQRKLDSNQALLKHARDQLQQLGQDVGRIDEALSDQDSSDTSDGFIGIVRGRQLTAATDSPSAELRLAQGSAIDLANLSNTSNNPALDFATQQRVTPLLQHLDQSRAEKRKRVDTSGSNEPTASRNDDLTGNDRIASRDAMPPPQLPVRRDMPLRGVQLTPFEAVQASNHGHLAAWDPSAPDHSFQSQHGANVHPQGTYSYVQNPTVPHNYVPEDGRHDEGAANKPQMHTESTAHGPTRQDTSPHFQNHPEGNAPRAHGQSSTYNEHRFNGRGPRMSDGRDTRTNPAAEDPADRVHRNAALRVIRDRGGFVEDLCARGNVQTSRYIPRTENHPEIFLNARGRLTPTYPSTPLVPSNMTDAAQGLPIPRPRNDGELDHVYQPIPRRPMFRPGSISPTRDRVTLPPTPRNTSSSTMRGPSGQGLSQNVRSSSVLSTTRMAQDSASQRNPLGQRNSTGPAAQSPYFASRTPSPQRHSLHSVSQLSLSGSQPTRASASNRREPSQHRLEDDLNDLPFLGDLAEPSESSTGRRRARR